MPGSRHGSSAVTPVAAHDDAFPGRPAKSCVLVICQNPASLPAPPPAASADAAAAISPAVLEYAAWRDAVLAACAPREIVRVDVGVLGPELDLRVATVPAAPPANATELLAALQAKSPAAVVATHRSQIGLLHLVFTASRGACFTIMADAAVSRSAEVRLAAADRCTVNMVSHVPDDISKALSIACAVAPHAERQGTLDCPWCASTRLLPHEMWHHTQLFHINVPNSDSVTHCPICSKHIPHGGLYVHMHDAHAPPGTHLDSRADVRLYSFGLCVIRRRSDGRFLCVQEYASQGFWLPGGGIDPSELPWVGAERECMEEAGVRVRLTHVLRVEVSPHHRHGSSYCRMRYIFYGEPADEADCEPKTLPDFESAGAAWVAVDELRRLRLRGGEPVEWFEYVARGGQMYPMSLFGLEGASP
jgi:8-oxo-dGTP pyrophosphatase MutT (NUDIX family)